MVNVPKLKGVHLAMHAGMFAAESIYERLKAGQDCSDLSNYQEAVESSFIESDLYRSRNMRQALSQRPDQGRHHGEHHGDLRRASARRASPHP